MQMVKALKLMLKADEKTFRVLDGQSRICNWLYNYLLEKTNGLRSEFIETGIAEHAKTIYTERGLRNLLPSIKEENPFLKSVHSSPLKNTALRLSSSIQAHQKTKKGKRKGKIPGWPTFRSWKAKWMSLFYDEPNKGYKIAGDILTLSLGTGVEKKRHSIQFRLQDVHLLKDHIIRNLRITKEAGIYYAVFTVAIDLPKKKPIKNSIALDPNHKNFAYGVDEKGHSIEIAAPSWLKNYDKRIDELKSKRDRCLKKAKQCPVVDQEGRPIGKNYYEPSKRWQKFHKAIEKALHKRREQTKTFMFTLAHRLCRKYDCIGIGDYAPNGEGVTVKMRRAMNNRSLIGRFKEILIWTAEKSGKTAVEYDERGTTRTCHACGYVHENGLAPSIRDWECPDCRTTHTRDENAAKNGLRRVLRDLRIKCETFVSSVPGSGLVSVVKQWAWCVRPSGVKSILRGFEQQVIAASRN
jgi:putative transposase